MMKKLSFIFLGIVLSASLVFAEEQVTPALESESVSTAPVAQETAAEPDLYTACTVEKDSLKNALELEQAKSENWEKSYNTIKQNNAVCAQALSVSIGVNEKKKEKEAMDRQQAAMMTSTSFLGGLGLGMLLFWLIFD